MIERWRRVQGKPVRTDVINTHFKAPPDSLTEMIVNADLVVGGVRVLWCPSRLLFDMNRLPAHIDLSFFHGQRLMQVCVGAHDLLLHFDEGVSISIESEVACTSTDGTRTRYDDLTRATPFVIAFLDRSIVSAQGTPDGTLHLEFDDRRHFHVYDSNEHYESYVITHGDQTIVV